MVYVLNNIIKDWYEKLEDEIFKNIKRHIQPTIKDILYAEDDYC